MPTQGPITDEPEIALLDEGAMRANLEEYNKVHPANQIQFEFTDGVLHLGRGQKETVLLPDTIIAYQGDIQTHARLWTEKGASNHPPMIVSGGDITINGTAHGLGSEHLVIQADGDVRLQNNSYMGAVGMQSVHDIDIAAKGGIVIDRINVRDAKLIAPVVETADEKGIDLRPSFTNVKIGQPNGTVKLAGTCHDCEIKAESGSVYQADRRTRAAAPSKFNCGFDPHHQQSSQQQQVTITGRSLGSGRA